jgi:peptidoglycan/LPS O-acetylase OafA/YrhL
MTDVSAVPFTVAPAPESPPISAPRDRYLDFLRAAAIARVVCYHVFGFAWLSFLFPAMGVMFALGGSLMVNSMRRSTPRALRGRVRRLLPALWVMGLIVVPAMIWRSGRDGEALPFPLWELVLWVVPAAAAPGTDWAAPATQVLWYIAAYLWFVLLSPLLWWAYQRSPVLTVLCPLLGLAAVELGPGELAGLAGDTLVNLLTFGTCWIVGFAHRTGQLRRMRLGPLAALAACCLVSGAAWAVTHRSDAGIDLNEIPLAQALYSLGFVLLLLRISPSMSWLRRVPPLDTAVTALNSRAVTTYLWHNIAIELCYPLGDLILVWQLTEPLATIGYFILALALLAIMVVSLGWVEDLAARRRPRLLPAGRMAS